MTLLPDVYEGGSVEADSKTTQPSERICVEIDNTNPAEPKIKLKQQSWARGMGWFTQKTITASVEEATALSHELEQASISAKLRRSQLHHQKAASAPSSSLVVAPHSSTPKEGKLLQFPTTRSTRKPSEKPVDNEPGKVLVYKPGKR